MATSSTVTRSRAVTTVLSALTTGAVAASLGVGVASARQPAPLPPTPKNVTDRILSVVETGNDAMASRTVQLQYVNPHSGVTYLSMSQYAGAKRNYIMWEKDTPKGGGRRLVQQIDIDPQPRVWSEQTATVPARPAPAPGIQSTGNQVKQAIEQGNATKQGLTKIARETVEMLLLPSNSKRLVSRALYVNQATDEPVAEIEHMKSGLHTFTVTSSWDHASPSAVSQVESKPSIPAGYTKSSKA